jgi:hypothetical protein
MTHRLIGRISLALLLIATMMVSCGQKQEEDTKAKTDAAAQTQSTTTTTPAVKPVTPSSFVGVEKQLMDTLLALWEVKGNLTSVDQAAKMLGVVVTDSVRAEILKQFEANLAVSERLKRYHGYTFVLTNQEKLISQYIMNSEKKNSEFPTLKQIATDLKLSATDASERLKFLAKIGLLYDLGGPNQDNKLGFSYGGAATDFAYDMGLRFHQFIVDNQLPFNVGCAKEALYIVASQYPTSNIRYNTVDPVSLAPIEVSFASAQITAISPDSACFLEGGTCGTNDLFASRENATTFTKTQPQLARQAPPIHDYRERLAQVVEELKQSSTGGK